jgi:arrestin-related trafficking adapter 4/5/7
MGNYEFPFEVLLPGDTPESVEGLYDCWIVYRMKATIARGRLAHKLHARKHLRVVRTLDPSSLEISHATVRH